MDFARKTKIALFVLRPLTIQGGMVQRFHKKGKAEDLPFSSTARQHTDAD